MRYLTGGKAALLDRVWNQFFSELVAYIKAKIVYRSRKIYSHLEKLSQDDATSPSVDSRALCIGGTRKNDTEINRSIMYQ